MLVRIDVHSATPLFEQVAASIRRDVLSGIHTTGDRLPRARDVAAALEVNVHTVLHAYQLLRDEGLVDLRRGRGAIVTDTATNLRLLQADIEALVGKAASFNISRTTLAGLVKEMDS